MKRILLVLFVGLLLVGCSAAVSEAAGRTTLQDGDGVEIDMATSAVGSAYTGGVSVQGGVAETTVPTAVTDGQAAALWVDEYGRQVIKGANVTTGSLDVEVIAPLPVGNGSMLIIDETLDADPTFVTSPAVFIGDCKSVSFMLNAAMDWVDSSPDLDLDLSLSVSADNVTYYELEHIVDSTGADSPVTSPIALALSGADTDTTHTNQYYLPKGFTAQYIRAALTATNSDANDVVVADLYLTYQK